MSSWPARAGLYLLLISAGSLAGADEAAPADDEVVGTGTATVPMGYVNVRDPWLDRVHAGVFNSVWRSGMHIDQ